MEEEEVLDAFDKIDSFLVLAANLVAEKCYGVGAVAAVVVAGREVLVLTPGKQQQLEHEHSYVTLL
jgi:hypothetical protein